MILRWCCGTVEKLLCGAYMTQDVGQGLALILPPAAPLVTVSIVDAAIEQEAIETVPVDEGSVCEMHEVTVGHKVAAGIPF